MSGNVERLIADLEAEASNAGRDDIPRMLGELERIRAVLQIRLATPPVGRHESRPEHLLTIKEAASRLGVSVNHLYRNHHDYPFTRRLGRKLRFSERELDEYLKNALA